MKFLVLAAIATIVLLIAFAGLAINLFFNRPSRIKSCDSKDGSCCSSSCIK